MQKQESCNVSTYSTCLNIYRNHHIANIICDTNDLFCFLVTGLDQEPEFVLNDNCVRFRCLELTQEGQWHHLVLIFNRAGIMKNSSVSLYVDAELVSTQKVSEE